MARESCAAVRQLSQMQRMGRRVASSRATAGDSGNAAIAGSNEVEDAKAGTVARKSVEKFVTNRDRVGCSKGCWDMGALQHAQASIS